MNVKTTFLNGDLYEDVYKDQLVGFKENVIDQCIYMKNSGSKFVILILYVDDILLVCNNMDSLFETKQMLTVHFDMKDLGDALFIFWD